MKYGSPGISWTIYREMLAIDVVFWPKQLLGWPGVAVNLGTRVYSRYIFLLQNSSREPAL